MTTLIYVCCVSPELSELFGDMLSRNKDAVAEAKKNLDEQTCVIPMATDWPTDLVCYSAWLILIGWLHNAPTHIYTHTWSPFYRYYMLNLCYLATQLNWKILLDPGLTACVPLLVATNAENAAVVLSADWLTVLNVNFRLDAGRAYTTICLDYSDRFVFFSSRGLTHCANWGNLAWRSLPK